MDMRCPYCEKSLGWKILPYKPTKGSPQLLQNPTVACCSYCGHSLANNPHPKEKALFIVGEVMTGVVVLVGVATNLVVALWLGGAVVAMLISAAIYVRSTYLHDWPRYVRNEAEG